MRMLYGIVGIAVALIWLPACGAKSGNGGGGTGGAGGSGPTDAGTDHPVAMCTGCLPTQVCLSGSCVDVPSSCPCPKETYCDLAKGSCVVGCTGDDQCDTGRI